MSWKVPQSSSSPPSTPGANRRPGNSLASHPSTTPAGPPPSSTNSFTPVGPPPLSPLGSSRPNSQHAAFLSKPNFAMNLITRRDPNSAAHQTYQPSRGGRPLGNSQSSTRNPSQQGYSSESDDVHEPGEDDMNEEGASEESERETRDEYLPQDSILGAPSRNQSFWNEEYSGHGSPLVDGMPRGVKRSRGGATISQGSFNGDRKIRSNKKDSAIPTLAKNMTSQFRVAHLDDPDKLILRTESAMGRFHTPEYVAAGQEPAREAIISNIVEDLSRIWRTFVDHPVDGLHTQNDYIIGIGPDENAPGLPKASFLATLLLQLHHPPPAKGKQASAVPLFNQSMNLIESQQYPIVPPNLTAIPKILVDWLQDNYSPYTVATKNLISHKPNPTAHVNYWDLVLSLTLRGQLSAVLNILRLSDFKRAWTAREDERGQDGYHGTQLGNIERVIDRAVQLFELCPVLQDDDWNVTGSAWHIFRKRVEHASDYLTNFAEGRDRDLDPLDPAFEASNFGIKNPSMKLSQSSRQAESKVPWSIYQNLKAIYGVFLGGSTEIISCAQNWVEATIGLTIWWDGDDDDDEFVMGSSAMSRRALRHSVSRGARLVDINHTAAYLRRLASAFGQSTDTSDETMFQINPINVMEVGLASLCEGNVEQVLAFLRGWSLPISSAVVQIASLGGWYNPSAGATIMAGFNESDLMVLSSYDQADEFLTRDGILIEYGEALFDKDDLQDPEEQNFKEGWELSLAVLIRLDDTIKATNIVGDLLSRISLRSDQRVDKIIDICQEFGIQKEAEGIAERYADSIAEESDRYGTALIYYARAHRTKKVKDVLDLLVSLSVVQSLAFPPLSSIDHNLKALISWPKESLDQLAELDEEAATILHTYLTGYATLRNFYDLRDEEVNQIENGRPSSTPTARKKAAAAALLAVINSAADSIHGGLYDENRGSVVQVDGLLALLGEALVFVDQPQRLLSQTQCFTLLQAIEDIQTVAPRIYRQCEECFRSTLAAAHGSQQAPSPRELLRKTVSNMTSSSGFSLVGSCMLESRTSNGGGGDSGGGGRTESGSGSGVLILVGDEDNNDGRDRRRDFQRGWDWRKGMKPGSSAGDALRILRLGLAKDLSRGWLKGEV